MTVRRNPEPSLLRSLLHDHLDAGYAASAAAGRNRPRAGAAWLVGGCLVMGLVLGTAAAQQLDGADESGGEQAAMVDQVRALQSHADALAARRDALATQEDDARTRVLAGDAAGAEVLRSLQEVQVAAATSAVHGPGVVVRIAEPAGDGGLSGSDRPQSDQGQAVLDRDLREVVNALWAAGAEAVGVNGVRIGPNVAVRQAGGAILVDNQPVASPYEITAIGPRDTLNTDFVVSPAYLRMQSLAQLYGVDVAVDSRGDVSLPRARTPELRYARSDEEGPR